MQFNQAPAPRESSLGDAYDPTASYSVDDLCIHDNVLYKCISPISGGEAWNPAHWTETNIVDEISALNSKLNPDAYTSPTNLHANVSTHYGGYVKCGKLVFVNTRFSLSGNVAKGENIARYPGYNQQLTIVTVTNNQRLDVVINKDGWLVCSTDVVSSGVFIVTCAYVAV